MHTRTAPDSIIDVVEPVAQEQVDAAGRFGIWVLLFWMSTAVIEGPLRGGLSMIGLPNLLYARDLLVATTVAIALLLPLTTRAKFPPGLVLMTWVIAVHLCIGLLIEGNLFQRLFGLKIFMPLLYGAALYPAIQQHQGLFRRAMTLFFLVSVGGVYANALLGEMPWANLSYDTAFGQVQTTREWWAAGGTPRLAGLARASFDAAMIIGLSGTVMLATTRSFWLRLMIAATGLTAITLTTSKGMVLAFAVVALWLVFSGRSTTSLRVGKWIVAGLLVVTCAVPAVFMFISVQYHPTEIPAVMSSLWDRFAWMWPNAYALLPDGYGPLLGVGPGGIGSGLDHPVELWVPNSGDSIFVYFYVTFGLLGVLYLVFPLFGLLREHADERRDPQAFVWVGLLVIAYGYGLSINMIEQPVFAAIFGLLYGAAFSGLSARRAG
jgi:hypothetical protein